MNNEPAAWIKLDEVREHFESVGCGTVYKTGGEGRVPLYLHPAPEPTDNFIYKNHMGYVSPGGAFYAPDYPTWKQDGFTPVYREPVAKTLTDEEFDNIFANGKRLGVLETEDRFRKAMNLTDEEIKETLKIYYPRNADNHINDLVWFARALLRKAEEK